MAYWNQVCPNCGQGRLRIKIKIATQKPFLLCEECESSWGDPDTIGADPHGSYDFGQGDSGFNWTEIRDATANDIRAAGWDKYEVHDV